MNPKKSTTPSQSAKKGTRLLEKLFEKKIAKCPQNKLQPRPLTVQERSWLIRGLESLRTGEYVGYHAVNLATGKKPSLGPPINPQPYLDQLDDLVVIEKCNCGQKNCQTVKFRRVNPKKIETLVMHNTEDGRWLVITAHKDTHKLAELEVI